jgi:anaerobic selenocysteine-containing dehydrogenase
VGYRPNPGQRDQGVSIGRKRAPNHPRHESARRGLIALSQQLKRVAERFATQKPSSLIWCMGQTQHTVGTANVRTSGIALLLTGNVGKPGTGANIFRGHDNVQDAIDVGLDIVTLPVY